MNRFEFDLQRFALTIPDTPVGSAEATAGKDYLLYIAAIVGPATTESWCILGGQKGATIDESSDDIDATTKTTGGYKATLQGLTSWSIDFDALALLPGSDNGVTALKIAKAQRKQIKVKVRYPDNSYRVGWCSSSTYTVEASHDGAATLKGKLNGNGPLSNESVFVSIAAAADQTFYFDKKSIATSVKLDSVAVDAASFVATVEGQITLKSAYLATLAAGEHLFYVYLSTGGYALVAITVTA